MAYPSDLEARLTALEACMEEVAADAAAARHLAAARDRDLADIGVKVDANRSAINALGVQTAAGFEETRRGSPRCAASSTRPPPGNSRSSTYSPPSSPDRATSSLTPVVGAAR